MQGDFSRWTFDDKAGYRSVLLQQGRVLLDADWNEQTAITARHDEIRTRDVVGRAGGPASGAAFAVTDGAGATPSGTAWADLRVSTGRFYVAGTLVETPLTETGPGPALADQPFLRRGGSLPGLVEPTTNGRYAVVLDVWTRHVTADEAPDLLESALGGPDTTTRAQTVWQLRLRQVGATDTCSGLAGASWLERTPPTMTASLAESPPGSDPCQITTSAGYRRLENQLYRVQVASVDTDGTARYVWSRENGSVVAGLVKITPAAVSTHDADLHLDRRGRDEELSFGEGDLVEVTSRDRELHGLPALLATAGAPDGLVLPVTWLGAAGSDPGAADVTQLGAAPVVRRWEGGPTTANTSPDDLEGGIRVAFGTGEFRIGDYWLLPARTVRLVYGVSALAGTLEWPTTTSGDPVPQPPVGPVHNQTVVAVLQRTGDSDAGAWSLVSDCRRLTPALTELVTIDLLGGDGQESVPGVALPESVRVVVRNGGLPVTGARVRFRATGDHLAAGTATPSGTNPQEQVVTTDSSGHAEVGWLLDGAPDTHTLFAALLDDADEPVGAEVRVTARHSVASQVAWEPACTGLAEATTVQLALERLATTADLRLLGGDGQQVPKPGATAPHAVRVVLDSPCGPVAGATVSARASSGGRVVPAPPGEPNPGTLTGGSDADATTDDDGVAAFWWQPDVAQQLSDALDIASDSAEAAPVRVTAHRSPAARSARTPGVHITGLHFSDSKEFLNDDEVPVASLVSGIMVDLDAPVVQDTVRDKPVVRVLLDLPWPVKDEATPWEPGPIGFRTVELEGTTNADGPLIVWHAAGRTGEWLRGRLPEVLAELAGRSAVVGRFVIDGWAVVSEDDTSHHLNGHARTFLEEETGRTRLELPTDDEVTGGQFVQWFHLVAG
ncbi:MAG: DUF6519 domain-containing protein [Actinomycetota bacterium]|nr:DUF6519 domain-containing protein [Actinomycetota bacterium]